MVGKAHATLEACGLYGAAPFGGGADGHDGEGCATPDPPVVAGDDREQRGASDDEKADDEAVMTKRVNTVTEWQPRKEDANKSENMKWGEEPEDQPWVGCERGEVHARSNSESVR